MGQGADRAGEFADAHVFGGVPETREVALSFGIPVRELEAEGDGFGVDAVGASDLGRVFELPGALLESLG